MVFLVFMCFSMFLCDFLCFLCGFLWGGEREAGAGTGGGGRGAGGGALRVGCGRSARRDFFLILGKHSG